MPRRGLLTPDQREKLLALPIDEAEFIRVYTLTAQDLGHVHRRREAHNRLGFAVQLCCVRYPGQSLKPREEPSPRLLAFVAQQLDVEPQVWSEYARRDQTRRAHLQEIQDIYGYRLFASNDYKAFGEWLLPAAMQTDQGMVLAMAALEEMRRRRLMAPPLRMVEQLCAATLSQAQRKLFERLAHPLSLRQRQQLETLLGKRKNQQMSALAWLRQPAGATSPANLLELISRLQVIREIGLTPELAQTLHQNRLRKLARIADQTTTYHLRRFDVDQRHAHLVALLLETEATITDEILDMHDRVMGRLFAKAQRRHDQSFQEAGRSINEKVRLFVQVGRALASAKSEGVDPFAAIEAVMPWDSFVQSVAEAEQLSRPASFDSLGLVSNNYSQIRRYSPVLLKSFDFRAAPAASELLDAIHLLRKLNAANARLVPPSAPMGFIRKRWMPYIMSEKGIDRRYYELCVLAELKNSLRSGDMWVAGSRQFRDFSDYLLTPKMFSSLREEGLGLPVEQDGECYLEGRFGQLRDELDRVERLAGKGELPNVTITNGVLKITPLAPAVPGAAAAAMREAYALIPHVRITELLLEVDAWTDFTRHFTHQKTGESPADRSLLLTALLAEGTNLGLTKMAEACPDATYAKLSRLHAWCIRDETYSAALAEMVNAQYRQPLAAKWGDGTTSSSDGQRYRAGGTGASAGRVNLKYGADPSSLIYSFVSDQYSPFYSKVINATVRDATHVLDGLLYHESDLRIEEHYTDTAGFTDHVFGLCHLLGFRFAPRIRDLADKKLYIPSKDQDYLALSGLIGGTIQRPHLLAHWPDVLRLAASIKKGTVSASLILRKLGSYPRQNGLARALREVGRMERTLFILKWFQDPELRRRVQVGLNKGEARNALARAVFFHRLGEMRDRTFENQNYRASGLNLIVAAIILWNTVYLERALQELASRGKPVDPSLIQHLSPLGWEHINLTGDYIWKLNSRVAAGQLRPLRSV